MLVSWFLLVQRVLRMLLCMSLPTINKDCYYYYHYETRKQERGMKCGECGEYYITGNVTKHSGYVLKHIFVPGVTQGNENAWSVQDFILLFLCLV